MISRETLEELWFQKLMEDYAQQRGEKYERELEEVIHDPEAAVPGELRQQTLRMIEERCDN